MFTLDRLELLEIALDLREPFQISSGQVQRRRILLLRVFDGDGAWGWGECVAGELPNYSAETVDTAWMAITEWIAPRLLGRRVAAAREVQPLLERDFRGHRMAKAAVEMAVWELQSRRRGISLAKLLGGTRKHVPVGISIGIQADPTGLARKAAEAVRAGYRKIKVKIQPGRDLEYLRAVCQAVSPALVMADANSAYGLDQLESLQKIDQLGLMMIEQPLSAGDLVRHAALQRRLRTPICLDESVDSLQRLEDMLTLGSGRILNLKPGRVGGLATSLRMHDLCLRQEFPLWCGGMLESGVGRGHNVALASLPGFTLPGDISPSRRYWDRDLVDPEWEMDAAGQVQVPFDRPGIGVEVNLERVRTLTVRRLALDRKGRRAC